MISISEKKLYKVIRNVGVKRKFIKRADKIDDLYLDDFDFKLLVFYFENEFNVRLNKNEISSLNSLPAFYQYINKRI